MNPNTIDSIIKQLYAEQVFAELEMILTSSL